MTKMEFTTMCNLGYASRRLIIEGLENVIKENGQAVVGEITLNSAQEVEALIQLVMHNGDAGFDMLDEHR